MQIIELNEETREEFKKILSRRAADQFPDIEEKVATIIERVRGRGDAALFDYSRQFDHFELTAENIRVSDAEIEEAEKVLDPEFRGVLERAAANIRDFHEKQKRLSWIDTKPDGSILGQKITAIEKVGMYVPGGSAPLSSSVLMDIIPAKVAGVDKIIMCTPPGQGGKIDPAILTAARIAGVDEIYRVGGAQAIAAMAHGTESIPKVHKICGPGNIFVALAKKAVYGQVGIDSIAGPSEILVLADESANARFVAADMLSQAEHDPRASAVLVTTSRELAEQVAEELTKQTALLSRKEIIEKSLEEYGFIFVAKDMDSAVETVNDIASEHLEIQTKDPFALLSKVRNAGAIFLGSWSSEPLGDYYAGPNHILPTNGTAKFFSPLSVDDFIKKSSIIAYSREALLRDHKDIELFAKGESLTAHANSVAVRFEGEEG
ncbi:MAG: histidinol dehydrogenase [Lachnospiraceae bacterium]|nr:histidinol dehydrogenase [Lachnospiraceae bacterium]